MMQTHDDLAALLSRNLVLDPEKIQHFQVQSQIPPEQKAPLPGPQKILYSISQHYHHSAHLVTPASVQTDPPASVPSQPELSDVEAIFAYYSIDPASLSRSQVLLFRDADDGQKLRLLELWKFCPPTTEAHESNSTSMCHNTSLEKEVQLGYGVQQTQNLSDPMAISIDEAPGMVPIQGGDGRWQDSQNSMMEPYMASGYEGLSHSTSAIPTSYNPATDPVYRSSYLPIDYKAAHMPIDWAFQSQQAMENQYGAFAQCRMDY